MAGSLQYVYRSTATSSAEEVQLVGHRCKLMSIKLHNTDAVAQTIYLYDDTSDTAGNLFATIVVAANTTLDLDYHGAMLGIGLYLKRAAVGSTGANEVIVSAQAR